MPPHLKYRQLLTQSPPLRKDIPTSPPALVYLPPCRVGGSPSLFGLPSLPGPAPPTLHSMAECPGMVAFWSREGEESREPRGRFLPGYSVGGGKLLSSPTP